METTRLRLLFEDRNILNKSQKKQGLKRSWILLKPQHQTILDLSSHLLYDFHLHRSCPNGLILSMDGFVLPPFESTCIFKDKDIISVKKKGGKRTEILKVGDGLNSLEELEIVEQPPVNTGVKLLASEEFDKQPGGYESEPEEDEQELEPLENEEHVESTPIQNIVSKKRKASEKLPRPKRKKSKLASAGKSPVSVDNGNDVHLKKSKSSHQRTALPEEKVVEKDNPVDIQGEPEKSSHPETDESSDDDTNVGRFPQLQETCKGSVVVSQTISEAKKLPSRSARRKKAKRQWLREQAKIEKEKLPSKQLHGKDNQQSPAKENLKVSEEHLQPVSNISGEDYVVPVVIRPGHIRFEPLETDAERAVQQSQISGETFQWNGITSKKKGQKWGKEKTPFLKRNDDKSFSQVSTEMVAVEEKATRTDYMDFEKLMPYSSLPKEGDFVAYRLVELSSSWTPELCSFRVGKISHYEAESNRIILAPVPEYPKASEKKIDGDESELQSDTSLYGEDGSLEIDYTSLIDVRLIKRGNSNTNRSVAGGISENSAEDQNVLENRQPNGSKEAALVSAPPPAQANGVVNGWEEISQALSAKKAELCKEDGWSQTESSGRSSWSYRALRRSALGPTMAFLRAQNGILGEAPT
ncbi:coilin isoform X2 [Herrania umbratica]|uniref:Coilin isoform X2 n=1 Tax=Herrania umbratica TaxID=108875 RepID=A0A6J1B2H2_9ROSI|nr:coilin isoform X2 [Herrania umbratica]